jgi:type IV pilus assembly protein PilC
MPSSKKLSQLCQSLSSLLDAGVQVSRALEVAAKQAGSPRLTKAVKDAAGRVDGGASLTGALRAQNCFPALFINLVEVGEKSGSMAEVFQELSRIYELKSRLWRRFLGQIAMPVFQYVAAVFVVSLARYIIGMIQDQPVSLWSGLIPGYGIPVVLIMSYFFFSKVLGGTRLFHEMLIRIPVLRAIFRAAALARFSLIWRLMLQAGFEAGAGLQQALEASGNAAFAARAGAAKLHLQKGDTFTDILSDTGLFPREYLEIVSIGEESGKLLEKLDWLVKEYTRRAEDALKVFTAAVAYLIWLMVACFIIYFIFTIFTGYISKISSLTGQ